MSNWLSRAEVLAALGIRPQTLYAYVSRGLIASRPDPSDPRRSLYSIDDTQALARKRLRGRKASDIARGAIAWGEAVMPTAISAIAHGRLYYRGRDAVRLAADGAGLEDAAALLWNVHCEVLHDAGTPDHGDAAGSVASALEMLARQAASALPTRGRAASALSREAALLLKSVARSLGAAASEDIAGGFARAWKQTGEEADLLRAALVLLAEHELNASTFATRVAASTGAPLAASLLAGFATLTGPAHGGASGRLFHLYRNVLQTGPASAIRDWLDTGEPLPGFGHMLYPDADPRAAALLARFEPPAALSRLMAEARDAAGLQPNIDFALVALTEALRLPADAPLRLFAAGRTCGWLAHAMEQAATGSLIRPRSYYSGPSPDGE